MKFEKKITINLGNYESLHVGISDAPSFEECDRVIIEHLKKIKCTVDDKIKQSLRWLDK